MNRKMERYVLSMLFLKGEMTIKDLRQNVADYKVRRGNEKIPSGYQMADLLWKSPMVVQQKSPKGTLWSVRPEFRENCLELEL